MDAIALELRARCVGCGQAVPINSCADGVACRTCRRAIALDWHALLARVFATPTETGTFAVAAGDATIAVTRTPDRARCPSCTAPLPDEVKQFAPRGWTMCPSCGTKLAIRTPPPALAWANAQLVVAEEMAAPAAPPAVAPVMIGCLACRAAMRVDGADRFARCASCGIDNYLPDELWLRMHPAPAVVRWFVVGGGAAMPVAAAAAAPIAPPIAAPMFVPPIVQATAAAVFGANVVLRDRSQSQTPPASPASNIIVHGREQRDDWGEYDAGPTKWSSLENVVMGPDGLFYCGGDISWGDAVWCMGDDLVPRWVHKLKLSDVKIALDVQHQRVVCWHRSKHSAIVLAMADGAMMGSIGGKEPDDAKVHYLDMEACDHVIGDLDGTLLAMMGDRLLRFDAHGTGVATWPPHSGMFGAKAEKLESIYVVNGPRRDHRRVESVDVENIGNHPIIIDDGAKIHIGRDGRLYAMYRQWVAAFDRAGKRLYKKKLPVDSTEHDPATDAQGNLYARGRINGDPEVRQVVRVSADGARVDVVATDRRARGSIGSEDHLCVAPDGTIYLFDYGMRARIIGTDGRLRWQSAKSLERDGEEDQRAADEA